MDFSSGSAGVLALWAAIGYGLGSIPFGLILAKAMNLGDLRKIGSGNIGATNVLRTGNKRAAVLTLLLDGGKGAVAVLIAHAYSGDSAAQIAALAAFLGHCYPVWLGFKGGKGVATFLGLLLALHWPLGLAACGIWLLRYCCNSTRSFSMSTSPACRISLAALSSSRACNRCSTVMNSWRLVRAQVTT